VSHCRVFSTGLGIQVAFGEGMAERVEDHVAFFAGLFAAFELDGAIVKVFQEENSLQ
jgi:hypothetical protein